jgi:predicted amidohydrolase YtcJ
MVFATLLVLPGCKKPASLLVYNATIYTVNEQNDTVQAMVVDNGRIMATGDEKDLRRKYHCTREIDLNGSPVYPGFIDAHCHFYGYGLTLTQADLTGTGSVEEILKRLQEHAHTLPSSWVIGRGWDQNDWQDTHFPNRNMLDKIFPDMPVYLVRIDGHAGWANSKALELAGITAETTMEGGEILHDADGPTGILVDNAMTLVEKLLPAPGAGEKSEALLRAEKNCFAVGLTAIGDAGLDRDVVMLVDSMQKAGRLHMRINAMLNPTSENTEQYIRKGIYVTDGLTVRSIKLYADGALGSRGALLKSPYSDDPGNRGVQVTPLEKLENLCKLALQSGYQVNTHCIGDSAVSLMLYMYSGLLPMKNDLRWRIEHAQVVDPPDLHFFADYNIIPSVQTTHATSDMRWAGERLGRERISHAYAYKTLLAQNGWLPNGSDFPVESINPVYGFYAAVARKELSGYPAEGYRTEEALSRPEALKAMTLWAARSCFWEKETGSLEPGKKADFVVLDRDIMKVKETEIAGAKVLETWSGGKQMTGKEE